MTKSLHKEPIAIIGIGCTFPGGASSPNKLWELLCQGIDAIVDVPQSRWDPRRFYSADPQMPGKMNLNRGGFLQEPIDEFDAPFFQITPREADAMDPQQRLLLETSWKAFEDGGILPSSIKGSRTAVYIGGFTTDWQTLNNNLFNLSLGDIYSGINASQTILSARLAHFYDLKGPCLTIDTACSSSLVAVHLACNTLRSGESSLAIAGGVNAILVPNTSMAMSKGRFLNPKGQCRSFDANGQGYVRGEGAGIVILKPLSKAIADGNAIYALIRATGINHDGHTNGIAMPNPEAQKSLILDVLKAADIASESIQYIEAHGTGTPAGDPTEAWAIDQALHASSKHPCLIGSIKSNIGHLEAAAGVAGLIKAALCLKHRMIPKNLHFDTPNPNIPFDKNHLVVPTTLTPFPEPKQPLFAGVNSFGYGGTNAHAILEEFSPPKINRKPENTSTKVIPLSAHTTQALLDTAKNLHDHIETNPSIPLEDIAYTLINKRERFSTQTTLIADTTEILASQLSLLFNKAPNASPITHHQLSGAPKVAFVYTGMGPQWHAMGMELYNKFPIFRDTLNKCNHLLQKLTGWSLIDELQLEESLSNISHPTYAQPANFCLQIALTELLKSFQISPEGVVGHSIGEVAAATSSGALTLEEGILVSYHRSRIQAKHQGMGKMLAVESNDKQIDELLTQYPNVAYLAAKNSPTSYTLSGEEQALQEIAALLDQQNLFNRFLKVDIAYHSGQMDPLEEELKASLTSLSPCRPTITLFSTVDQTNTTLDNSYWWRNVRESVRFHDAIENMIDAGYNTFIEIGPHPVLGKSIQETLQAKIASGITFQTLNRKEDEKNSILNLLGNLSHIGITSGVNSFFSPSATFTPLPHYPWQRKRHWTESPASSAYYRSNPGHPMLSQKCRDTPYNAWKVELNEGFFPWLHDHQIDGSTLFPGAAYVEAGLLLHQQQGPTPCILENIRFHNALTIAPSTEPILRLSLRSNTFEVHSSLEDSWNLHASGTLQPAWKGHHPPSIDLNQLKASSTEQLTKEQLYPHLTSIGLQYGPSFQRIKHLWKRGNEALSELDLTNLDPHSILAPPLFDAALQTLIGTVLGQGDTSFIPIPASIESLHFHEKPSGNLYCYAKAKSLTAKKFVGDLTLVAEDGRPFVEAKGITCTLLNRNGKGQDLNNLLYQIAWTPQTTSPKGTAKDYTIFIPSSPSHEVDTKACCDLISLIQNRESCNASTPYTLWVITRTQKYISDSMLWGLSRVTRNEYPHINLRLLDLDATDTPIEEIISQAPESSELHFRNNTFYTPSLTPITSPSTLTMSPKSFITGNTKPYTLELTHTGSIENLYFRERNLPPLKKGEVKIAVHTASINFKDLMKVLGLLNENVIENTFFGDSFGMECSGTIIDIAPNVKNRKVGDRVVAFCKESFSSQLIVDAHSLCPIPDNISFEEAPALIPFITVLKGLHDIAKLKKGETILIHTATGAVGLAAVQYAQHVGAIIVATAGSDGKRDYLTELGVTHVADSRSTRFHEQILEWTHGKGVDVILNSLSGDALQKSWDLLAPYGRFIEIGKRDISENNPLPMGVFNRNALFAAIDLDRTFAEDRPAIQKLIKQTLKLFDKGVFKPLPYTLFPASSICEAFHFFARAKHIGKVAVTFAEGTVETSPPISTNPLFDKMSSYLITGGLSGFGLATAEWIVNSGGKHIILLSRRGKPDKESRHTLQKLKKAGAKITCLPCDVADINSLTSAFSTIQDELPPLKGVFHAATLLDDAFIQDLTPERFDNAIHAKAKGAWNLHLLTKDLPLDHFLLYSSISSLIGNPGQANYSAANAFLDHLSTYRKSLNLPSLTINWGAIGETGLLQRNTRVATHLKAQGIHPLTLQQAFNSLDFLLRLPKGSVDTLCLAHIEWHQVLKALPTLKQHPLFSRFSTLDTHTHTSDMKRFLIELDPESQLTHLITFIQHHVAKILRVNIDTIDPHTKLQATGIDSLMAMELQHEMEKNLGIKIPTMELVRGPSIHELSSSLVKKILDG